VQQRQVDDTASKTYTAGNMEREEVSGHNLHRHSKNQVNSN
jgi:hypothetical protein